MKLKVQSIKIMKVAYKNLVNTNIKKYRKI